MLACAAGCTVGTVVPSLTGAPGCVISGAATLPAAAVFALGLVKSFEVSFFESSEDRPIKRFKNCICLFSAFTGSTHRRIGHSIQCRSYCQLLLVKKQWGLPFR